ncbi:MAG: hypothetical protein ABSF34_19635, partial [Verrucomicrobiota bacterium]
MKKPWQESIVSQRAIPPHTTIASHRSVSLAQGFIFSRFRTKANHSPPSSQVKIAFPAYSGLFCFAMEQVKPDTDLEVFLMQR